MYDGSVDAEGATAFLNDTAFLNTYHETHKHYALQEKE